MLKRKAFIVLVYGLFIYLWWYLYPDKDAPAIALVENIGRTLVFFTLMLLIHRTWWPQGIDNCVCPYCRCQGWRIRCRHECRCIYCCKVIL